MAVSSLYLRLFLRRKDHEAIAAVCSGLAFGSAPFLGLSAGAKEPAGPPRPTVQIAILLDTSNSMDGLIAQAKSQLWNVVNEFVRAKKDGRPPAIQVALFEYGNNSLTRTRGSSGCPAADRRPRPRLGGAVRA